MLTLSKALQAAVFTLSIGFSVPIALDAFAFSTSPDDSELNYEDDLSKFFPLKPAPAKRDVLVFLKRHLVRFVATYSAEIFRSNHDAEESRLVDFLAEKDWQETVDLMVKLEHSNDKDVQSAAIALLRFIFCTKPSDKIAKTWIDLVETLDATPELYGNADKLSARINAPLVTGTPTATLAGIAMKDGVMRLADSKTYREKARQLVRLHLAPRDDATAVELDVAMAATHAVAEFPDLYDEAIPRLERVLFDDNAKPRLRAAAALSLSLFKMIQPQSFDQILATVDRDEASHAVKSVLLTSLPGKFYFEDAFRIRKVGHRQLAVGAKDFKNLCSQAALVFARQLQLLRQTKDHEYERDQKKYAELLLVQAFGLITLFPRQISTDYTLLYDELGEWMPLPKSRASIRLRLQLYLGARHIEPSLNNKILVPRNSRTWAGKDLQTIINKTVPPLGCPEKFSSDLLKLRIWEAIRTFKLNIIDYD